jgi:hypothetical protein
VSKTEIPNIRLSSFLAAEKKLWIVFRSFEGQKITADNLELLTSDVLEGLNGASVNAVRRTLTGLVGKTVDLKLAKYLSIRFAGNAKKFKECESIPVEFVYMPPSEWFLVRIDDVFKAAKSKKNEDIFKMTVCSGLPAGETLTQVWSSAKQFFLAKFKDDRGYGFGFSKSRLDRAGDEKNAGVFYSPRQFVGLFFFGLLAINTFDNELKLDKLAHSSMSWAHNRELIKLRDRKHAPCIKKPTLQLNCCHCPISYRICKLSTKDFQ